MHLKGIKFGVATASAQIEGGEVGSNWNHYSDLGKITDGSNIKRACDHWNRWEEDVELLAKMGIKHYRMSIEWARIEPKQGKWKPRVMERYVQEIEAMQAKGIEVLLTLHHFSHPQWFEDLGGFAKLENSRFFLTFVDYVVRHVGHLVKRYCTINEPNVYAVNGYFFGEWLQEQKSFWKTMKVMNVFAFCHIRSYELIKKIFQKKAWGESFVSFALNVRYFSPYRENFVDRLGVKVFDFLFNTGVFHAFALGDFRFPFRNIGVVDKGQYLDYIAVNYYTRGLVHNFNDRTKEDAYKNDLGWEIYPAGIVECAKSLYEILPLPIAITENGTCDNADSFRPRYIYEHLKPLVESDLPISHYYHWCFTDNFEWKEGELPRFGLVHLDYETQKRTIKQSGYFYQEIIEKDAIDEDMYHRYVASCSYHKGERTILSDRLPEEEWRNKR